MRPIITCIVGHVDAGKTSLSDILRDSHTEEVGGITQKISGTTLNKDDIKRMMGSLCKSEPELDGILLLDTPGHSCYTTIKTIGIDASDIVIVVVDIIKGLEKETIGCLEILEQKKIPYVIALNKVDKIYGYICDDHGINLQKSYKLQSPNTMTQLKTYSDSIICQLATNGINAALYYENKNIKEYISMVPISAKTGIGIPDLIMLLVKLIKPKPRHYGFIIENQRDEKFGNGYIAICNVNKHDTIICIDQHGDLQKCTVKNVIISEKEKADHNSIRIAFIKIAEPYKLMSGQAFYNKIEDVVQTDTQIKLSTVAEGVYYCVPSVGMLHACLQYYPMSGYTHKITKADIIKAKYKKHGDADAEIYNQKYSVILNYSVPVDKNLLECAKLNGVKIITNTIIHRLFEEYDRFKELIYAKIRANHPTIIPNFKMNVLPQYIFSDCNPMTIGVKVITGRIHCGDIVQSNGQKIGQIMSIQKNKKSIDYAEKDEVCLSINTKEKYNTSMITLETYYSEGDMQLISKYPDVFGL